MVGTVNIAKKWAGVVPETLKDYAFPFKVEVDLDGPADTYGYSTYALEYTVDGTKYETDANGNFTLKSGQTAAFEGIPTGAKVKVTETKTTAPSIDVDGVIIETFKSSFGEVENLPPQEEGVMVIVSAMAADAAKDRNDLLVPGELVRDNDGNIIGCKSLRRP